MDTPETDFNPFQVPVEEVESPQLSDEALLQTYRERLCTSCAVAADAEEVRLRALAEMENFKKRLQREKDEQARYATENVLASLLPTLDNFELALQYGSQVEACKDLMMGVEMTRKLLLDALKTHGLEPVGAEGDAFDPALHEALGQEESARVPAGHILKIMQRGYRLKERTIRPAKVIVSARSASHLDATV